MKPSENQKTKKQKDNADPSRIHWAVRLLFMVVLSGLMGLVAYLIVREIVLAGEIGYEPSLNHYFEPIETTPTEFVVAETLLPNITPTESPIVISTPLAEETLTPWDGKERVTVLVMGVDYRDWAAGSGSPRSDTMMLITMDPVSKTAGILSVPRDLWVAIPGYKHGKINTAHALGGPTLAVRTVELAIGVPINYYAVVDFGAFVRFIDELGGLKLDVPYKIKIDPLGGENVLLQPGIQTISGDWALAYARNRSKGDGDFDRARRQQQVILAIRNRILEFELLPVLIAKGPVLYRELVTGVQTNLQLDEVIKLAVKAQQIPDENIRQGVIDTRYVAYGWSPDNLSILIPYPDQIRVLRDQIFASSGTLGPLTPGNAQEKMFLEAATVSVQNASNTLDLAERTADYLEFQGAVVQEIKQVDLKLAKTKVIDHVGSPYTLAVLVEQFDIEIRNIAFEYDPGAGVDIEIILGNDWAANHNLNK